jgi:hypothetical protein
VYPTQRVLLALIAVIGATACGGAAGLLSLPPCVSSATTGLFGCVTNTRGGPAVSGATISASGATASATTNAQGAYTLSLNPGIYDIVAAKSGMATSKFQGVAVLAGQLTTANLIMFPVFDPTKLVAAPTISVSGLMEGQTVSGTVPYTVSVTASNPVRRIDIRTGNMAAFSSLEFVDTSTASTTLNSTAIANGPAFIDIITYDLNQNAAELVLHFTVGNPVLGAPPATPTGLSVLAVTFGRSLGLFRTQRTQRFNQLGISQDPYVLTVGSRSINLLTAPSGATLVVEPSWTAVAGVSYKVFRSSSPGGPFSQVAQVSSGFYDDADASLTPGVAVYYQVSAFNAGGESAPTTVVGVTPLAAFNLNLANPTNNATGVPTVPTFTWTPTAMVGVHQRYDIVVQGINDLAPACRSINFALVDVTNWVLGPGPTFGCSPLLAPKVYQWDIYQAEAQTVYSPNSVAIAVANGGAASGSLNGPFTFTTTQ